MKKKDAETKIGRATFASVKKQMAEPRMAKSVRGMEQRAAVRMKVIARVIVKVKSRRVTRVRRGK